MPQTNQKHLTDITQNVERDFHDEDVDPSFIINNIDKGPGQDTSYMTNLFFDTHLLLNVFFQSRQDLPTDNESRKKFTDIAKYAAQLAMLDQGLIKLSPNKKNNNLITQYKTKLTELLNKGSQILETANFDVTYYIVFLLNRIKETDIVNSDQDLKGLLISISQSLLLQAVVKLPTNDVNQELSMAISLAIGFVNRHPELFENTSFIGDFIAACKKYYENQNIYMNRRTVMVGLINAFEHIKDKLSLQDIEWLEGSTKDLTQFYSQLPSRGERIFNNYHNIQQVIRNIDEGQKYVVGTNILVGAIFVAIYLTSTYLSRNSLEEVNKALKLSPEERQNNPELLRKIEILKYKDLGYRSHYPKNPNYLNSTNILEREKMRLEMSSTFSHYLPYFFVLWAGIMVGVMYLVNRPEPMPMPLPNWVKNTKHALQVQEVSVSHHVDMSKMKSM